MAKSESNHGEQPVLVNPGVHFPTLESNHVQQPGQANATNAMQAPGSPPFNPTSYSIPGSMDFLASDSDPNRLPLVNPYSPPIDATFDPVVRSPSPPSNSFTPDNLSTTSHTAASTSKTPGTQVISGSGVICMDCNLPMSGQFVKALGGIHHLDCFRCRDCNKIVAEKFFPIEGPDGKQHPLCETDYFGRLNLICHNCKLALRGSYITACNKKYHVEHFTCSVCPTVFGQQDSYYEHENDVYCHFHYSTRFATKCTGCNSAILKQFVEINRNMKDECWHPECYMIHKFWNVKVSTRRPNSIPPESVDPNNPTYVTEEKVETANTLKEKQAKMEQQVYRIWTVLSAFEESSAACISDMLRAVSSGQYLEAIRMAEKFILHVEILFAVIDDLEGHFAVRSAKGISHVREARMLCRKTVDLFTLLSRTHQESEQRRTGMTQELLALVTGIAHYLKILIRIALTGGLKLEREHNTREPINVMLDKLHLLAVRGGNPTAKRLVKSGEHAVVTNGAHSSFPATSTSTQGVSYGYKSLAPEMAGESPFWGRDPNTTASGHKVPNPPSDLCVADNTTVEEDCVRLGTYQRWHSSCVKCQACGKMAAPPSTKPSSSDKETEEGKEKDSPPKLSTARRAPANVAEFVYEEIPGEKKSTFNIFCLEHQHSGCQSGFEAVSRLEQYAFLLNVALRRLYVLLKQRGVIQVTQETLSQHATTSGPRDLLAIGSVHLDRKLSATARLPQRSTVVESPSGKTAHPASLPTTYTRPPEGLISQRSDQSAPRQARPQLLPSSVTSPNLRPTIQSPPPPLRSGESSRASPTSTTGDHPFRPDIERNNTRVKIVDETVAAPDLRGTAENRLSDDVLTLADIPQLVEAGQALEQRRSVPHQLERPLISDLSALELVIVKHCALLALYKSPLRDQFDVDEILELVESKKGGFWKQLFKEKPKNLKKKGVFGIPLELLVERDGFDSTLGLSRQPVRIPSFIDDVISAMRQMDISVEGIFRKNGNIKRLKDLCDAIDRDPSGVDLTTDNPVQLAALLKKFLRDLPDPLCTFKLHRPFISTLIIADSAEARRLLHMLAIILPKCHLDTMQVLFVFLKWVASFAHVDEKGNKMDLENLATVLAPNILYAKGKDPIREEHFSSIRVVSDMLEMQEELFMVPQEFTEILHDQEYFAGAMEIPSKDLLKKCDTYMRLKSNGRVPLGPGSSLMSPVLNGSHSPFNPQGPPFAIAASGSGTITPQDDDVRLVPQRSDPVLTRGRTTVSDGHHGRYSPPRRRQLRDSRSLERGAVPTPTTGSFATRQPKTSTGPHPPHTPLSQQSLPPNYDLAQSPPPRIHDPDRPPSSRDGSPGSGGSGSDRGFPPQSYSPSDRNGPLSR